MRTTAITGASARSVAHPGDTRGGVIRMRDFPLRLRPRYPCDMAEAFLARVRAFVPQAEAMGIPGAVLVAQAVLESGTTREWAAGRWRLIPGRHRVYASRGEALAEGCDPGALFRAYADVAGNVRDYLRFFH